MDELEEGILSRGKVDFNGLWEIVRIVQRQKPWLSANENKREVLAVVRSLVVKGYATLGRPVNGVFSEWDSSLDESMIRIDAEWTNLGQEPNIGEIVWLSNTSNGDEAITHLRASQEEM